MPARARAVRGAFVPVGTSGLAVTNCDPDYSVRMVGSRTQWNPHPYLDIGVDVFLTHLNTTFAGFGEVLDPQGARTAGPVASRTRTYSRHGPRAVQLPAVIA
jgi:hypothetical protein